VENRDVQACQDKLIKAFPNLVVSPWSCFEDCAQLFTPSQVSDMYKTWPFMDAVPPDHGHRIGMATDSTTTIADWLPSKTRSGLRSFITHKRAWVPLSTTAVEICRVLSLSTCWEYVKIDRDGISIESINHLIERNPNLRVLEWTANDATVDQKTFSALTRLVHLYHLLIRDGRTQTSSVGHEMFDELWSRVKMAAQQTGTQMAYCIVEVPTVATAWTSR
jgi:hypothetical protein